MENVNIVRKIHIFSSVFCCCCCNKCIPCRGIHFAIEKNIGFLKHLNQFDILFFYFLIVIIGFGWQKFRELYWKKLTVQKLGVLVILYNEKNMLINTLFTFGVLSELLILESEVYFIVKLVIFVCMSLVNLLTNYTFCYGG